SPYHGDALPTELRGPVAWASHVPIAVSASARAYTSGTPAFATLSGLRRPAKSEIWRSRSAWQHRQISKDSRQSPLGMPAARAMPTAATTIWSFVHGTRPRTGHLAPGRRGATFRGRVSAQPLRRHPGSETAAGRRRA